MTTSGRLAATTAVVASPSPGSEFVVPVPDIDIGRMALDDNVGLRSCEVFVDERPGVAEGHAGALRLSAVMLGSLLADTVISCLVDQSEPDPRISAPLSIDITGCTVVGEGRGSIGSAVAANELSLSSEREVGTLGRALACIIDLDNGEPSKERLALAGGTDTAGLLIFGASVLVAWTGVPTDRSLGSSTLR